MAALARGSALALLGRLRSDLFMPLALVAPGVAEGAGDAAGGAAVAALVCDGGVRARIDTRVDGWLGGVSLGVAHAPPSPLLALAPPALGRGELPAVEWSADVALHAALPRLITGSPGLRTLPTALSVTADPARLAPFVGSVTEEWEQAFLQASRRGLLEAHGNEFDWTEVQQILRNERDAHREGF